jgi:transcriptional regulator with XRE-family HTH domain
MLRAVRLRRRLRQVDVAAAVGVSHATVSLVERGHCRKLSLDTIRRIGAALDVRVEVAARWRGGDADRLLNRGHSLLADSFASFMASLVDWVAEPEVSFSIYGERGIIDELAWHPATGHLLVIELKTEFVDINELLGTLDRKVRLARTVAAGRGWPARRVSYWVIASASRTNRRHAAQHAALLRGRLRLDGRQFRTFLHNPTEATTGLAFWTAANPRSASPERGRDRARVRPILGTPPHRNEAAMAGKSAAGSGIGKEMAVASRDPTNQWDRRYPG